MSVHFTLLPLGPLLAIPAAAASANAYLAQLPSLACLHVLPDQAIEEECNEDGDVYAQQPIPLPGARSLTLPQVRTHAEAAEPRMSRALPRLRSAHAVFLARGCQLLFHAAAGASPWPHCWHVQGVLGEVLPLPEGLSSADSLWALPPGEDIEQVQLIRWRLSLPDGAGQWILLCRLAGGWTQKYPPHVDLTWLEGSLNWSATAHYGCREMPQPHSNALYMARLELLCPHTDHPPVYAEALALVQAPPAGTPSGAARLAAELDELSAGLRLLATFCSRDPQTALELLHVELPTSSAAEGLRGPDLLTLAVQAVAVLAAQPEPPTAVIGEPPAHGLDSYSSVNQAPCQQADSLLDGPCPALAPRLAAIRPAICNASSLRVAPSLQATASPSAPPSPRASPAEWFRSCCPSVASALPWPPPRRQGRQWRCRCSASCWRWRAPLGAIRPLRPSYAC